MHEQGANLCKQLGVRPGAVISRARLHELWALYDKDQDGLLDRDTAIRFAKDFCEAVKASIKIHESQHERD